MTKIKKEFKRCQSHIHRIESKCDRILSQLIIIRQSISRHNDMNEMIEKMHRAAREMRIEADKERDRAMKILDRHSI